MIRTAQARAAYLFIALPLALITTFVAAPCLVGIALSLFQYDAITPSRFVGLQNYRELARDPLIVTTLRNTLYYIAGVVPVGLLLAFVLALALNEPWMKVKTLFRITYFLPNVVSMVAVAFIWEWLLNPEFGLANHALTLIGTQGRSWLSDPDWAMPCVIAVGIWHGLGLSVIIYLAGLQGISETYYEAARIDGASKWQQIRYITWPLLIPTTMFLTIMGVISGFQVFQSVYIMTAGGPLDRTRVIVYYLWQNGFEFLRMGYASAIAVLVFVIILTLTLLQWRLYGARVVEQ